MAGETQTTGSVTYDYVWFQARYPDIARWVSPEMGRSYFDIATLYLDNSNGTPGTVNPFGVVGCYQTGSPVRDTSQRQILLGMLMAHIATLNAPIDGEPSSSSVGRLTSATEGSVSLSFDYSSDPGSEWFSQTKYGAMFWAVTARYRRARYYPGAQPFRQNPGTIDDVWGGGSAW